MKPRSMEEKISYLLFLMGFAGLACTAALCIFVFHKAFREQAWTALEREADLVAAGCAQVDAPSQLETYVDGSLRITLIASDGSVLFESATNQPMENHLSRPEIQQAMKSGVGRDCRDSQTLGYETYYYAMLLTNGDILRVAQDSETIWSIYDAALPAIVLSCFLMMGAAAIIAGLLTKSLVQPVLKMTDDLDHIQENVPYKELIPFAESIHSDRMLRENNEKMRQEFTANVSHELKTPLTSISGYAELMANGLVPPEDVPRFAQLIYEESQAMRALIDDVLILSRLDEMAPGDNETETVNLEEEASRVEGRLTKLAADAGVTVGLKAEPVIIRGNETLLKQMIYNLVENAIRYNRENGRVFVEVYAEDVVGAEDASGRGFVHDVVPGEGDAEEGVKAAAPVRMGVIRVNDTGAGIPADKLEKIFERFYRLEKSRSKELGGTGLGLAIVKHAALYHGGEVSVESEEDVGTRFTVRLPIG